MILLSALGLRIGIAITENYSTRLFGEHCNSDSECTSGMNYVCLKGVCNCSLNYYFVSPNIPCRKWNYIKFKKTLNLQLNNKYIYKEKLKSAYESCTNDTECCCGQYCSFNSNNNTSVCQCSSDRWWNDAINYCRMLLFLFIETRFGLNSEN